MVLAISKDPKQRLTFARRIAELCNSLTQEEVKNQLLPFLLDWTDVKDEYILYAIASQVIYLAIKLGGIGFVSPLIMLLITTDNRLIKSVLVEQIKNFKGDNTAYQFINALAKSPFDCIRAFAPKVVSILSNTKDIQTVLIHLSLDRSFSVKISVLDSLAQQDADIAKAVAFQFMEDIDERIRSYITAATVDFPFWASSLLQRLENDSSWRVRASVASHGIYSVMLTPVLPSLYKLSKDPCWEVRLLALRSISMVLIRNPMIVFSDSRELLNDISAAIKKNLQKSAFIAYCDVLIAIISSEPNRHEENLWSPIIESILEIQNSSVRLHFFITAAKSNVSFVAQALSSKFAKLLPVFIAEKDWRIRENVANSLVIFRRFFNSPEIVSMMNESVATLLNDYALPVKCAAAKFIAETVNSTVLNPIPDIINTLMKSDSFRQRQSAVIILSTLKQIRQEPEIKRACDAKLEELQSDKIDVVAGLAKNPDMIYEQ